MTEHPNPADEPVDPWLVDRMLSGEAVDADADAAVAAMADVVAALRAPATADELAGEQAAVAAFEGVVASRGWGRRAVVRRGSVLAALVGGKVALSAAGAAAAVSIAAVAAAYAGVLPAPLQDFAQHTIHAPAGSAARSSAAVDLQSVTSTVPSSVGGTRRGSGASAVATGGPETVPAAAVPGLCQAFADDQSAAKAEAEQHAAANSTDPSAGPSADHRSGEPRAAENSTAFQRLAVAAGGADQVEAFCAAHGHPSADPSASRPSDSRTDHPSTSHPSKAPTAKPPTSHPSTAPTGKPTTAPAHPSYGPTIHPYSAPSQR